MIRTFGLVLLGLVSMVLVAGCGSRSGAPAGQAGSKATAVIDQAGKTSKHAHDQPGGHGGLIAEIGRDNYHAEAVFDKEGRVKIYTLGRDETRVLEVEEQTLEAYAQPEGGMEGTPVNLNPARQPGDSKGKTSLFVGKLPQELWGKPLTLTVPITINAERFRFRISNKSDNHDDDPMPAKVSDDKERDLYLKPGGKYTEADIEANGHMTASEKFKGFRASHNIKPNVGDKICPVTLTKANPSCIWVIGGKSYEFCCPPCVDEFVHTAKEQPEEIKEPGSYVKQKK